jgi:hypothetical protein
MLFAYLGPETMMPMASIFAAIAGVFMMFGRTVVQVAKNIFRRIWPFSRSKAAPAKPLQTDPAVSTPSSALPTTEGS